MQIGFVALKSTRYDFYKSQTIAVVGVHVGVNFKDKTTKVFFGGVNLPFFCFFNQGSWSDIDKAIEQLLNTKIIEG